MFTRIKHPISFWLLIAYFIGTATMIHPASIWAVPMIAFLIVIGGALRWVCHWEARTS